MSKARTQILFFICLLSAIGLALYISLQLQTSQSVINAISSFGYIGVFMSGLIAGLNFILPVPAATMTPLFTQAGMTIPLIVVFLALGTLAADFIGYLVGHTSHSIIKNTHPTVTKLTDYLSHAHPVLMMVCVTIYAALIPLPNELILIPLAFAGISWRLLVIPLFVGAVVIQTLLVNGISLLEALF